MSEITQLVSARVGVWTLAVFKVQAQPLRWAPEARDGDPPRDPVAAPAGPAHLLPLILVHRGNAVNGEPQLEPRASQEQVPQAWTEVPSHRPCIRRLPACLTWNKPSCTFSLPSPNTPLGRRPLVGEESL